MAVTTGEGPETSISGRGHRQCRHPEVQCWKEPGDLGNSRGDISAEAPRRRGCWAGPTGRRTLWELGFSSPFRCNESSLSGGAGGGGARGKGSRYAPHTWPVGRTRVPLIQDVPLSPGQALPSPLGATTA